MSASLNIGEMPVNPAKRCHLKPVRMATVKPSSAVDAVDKQEPSSSDAGNISWRQPLWRKVCGFFEQWKRKWNLKSPQHHTQNYTPKRKI